jgi:hypothetical protein
MSSKATRKTAPKLNLYQTVTDRIIASLKAGVIPWEKPWKSPHFIYSRLRLWPCSMAYWRDHPVALSSRSPFDRLYGSLE